jgi:hypothetical protein
MAEKPKEKKSDKKKTKTNGGEMGFGTEIIIFVVALFVIWVLMGKPRTENTDKPFIKGQTVLIQ